MKLILSVVAEAGNEIDKITIKQTPATIGRSADNTVILEDPRRYISGHHATIDYRPPDYFITDTSANGVLINGAALSVDNGCSKLSDGDKLHIGDYTLVVSIVEEQLQVDIPIEPASDEVTNSVDPFPDKDTGCVPNVTDEDPYIPEQGEDSDSGIQEDKQNRPQIKQPPPAYREVIQSPKPEKKEKQSVTVDNIPPKWYERSQDEGSVPEVQSPDNPDNPEVNSPPLNSPDFKTLIVDNFLRGAGLEGAGINESLSPESFYIIGKILRTSIQGTMDVLIGRAKIKNEMHLDVTMIRSNKNNPVKFSVTAEEAIKKLLAPKDSGYLQAEEAIEEAFNDIRAHQFSVIAGMQAALLEVLKKFDPEKLEQRLQKQSPISASIPIHKQAKLWRLFENLYDDIEHEASDNFYHLFGQVFAESYEQQMIKLKDSKKGSPL